MTLPVSKVFSPEPDPHGRSLEVFDTIPPNHTAVGVALGDDRHWPHLRPGEFAVVDCTAEGRSIFIGELYLIRQVRNAMIWLIAPTPKHYIMPHREKTVMLRPLNGPRPLPDGNLDLTGSLHTSDGPIAVDVLQEMILGRVVGIYFDRAGDRRTAS